MIIRNARRKDLDKIFTLLGESFPEPRKYFVNLIESDPWYKNCQRRIGILNNKIIGNIDIFARKMWIEKSQILVGDIGNFCIHPDFRGNNYGRQLIEDAIKYMAKKNYDISMLFGGIPKFYKKFGWINFPDFRCIVKLTKIKNKISSPEDSIQMRTCHDEKDLEQVIRLYDSVCKYRTGSTVRTRNYWGIHWDWVIRKPRISFLFEKNGKVIGYSRCKQEKRGLSILEIVPLETKQALIEILKNIICYAASNSLDCVSTGFLTENHSIVNSLKQMNIRPAIEPNKVMMINIINKKSLSKKINLSLDRQILLFFKKNEIHQAYLEHF